MTVSMITVEYHSLLKQCDNVYSRIAFLVSLVPGIYLGQLLLVKSYMLPTVWKIYLSMLFALVAHFMVCLILLVPHQLLRGQRQIGLNNDMH
jgi:hypothetical protein